jgi:hypothetical protein
MNHYSFSLLPDDFSERFGSSKWQTKTLGENSV